MSDVRVRWQSLHETWPALRLYALVDGVQYQSHFCKRLRPGPGLFALFDGTPDAALAHAGPWLVETGLVADGMVRVLLRLEHDGPALSWLIAAQDLEGLGQLLQLRLDLGLPDGRRALLRFWDPRVLVDLAQTLDARQHGELFGHVHEWHLLHEGRRVVIGRHRAEAY
ncbi:DUF4123 domain-containing protein [Rubrivivax gelatinosus]|uniref:DUF4123 domain-containing protein n=1 Tax=Rubrivivax gelatinosus TaxID=28068 RepID=UPI0005C146B5|nr:DUF4123 domain-containing protein [Rubrivivax gelatinosus]MBG6078891.1 hypothetical protein [Rubrivivax gelatinosus]